MRRQRLPALLLTGGSLLFLVWGLTLVVSPGGSHWLEWAQTVVAGAALMLGIQSLRSEDPGRVTAIRWVITAFGIFGGIVVIGLTADDTSSRTWVRLGWAALLVGGISAFVVWWTAPRPPRRGLVVGGVVALIVIAAGVGITASCNESLQRSWCDPHYEQEEALVEQVVVDGTLRRAGRAGGQTGAAVRAYLINGSTIQQVTVPPAEFTFESVPIRSTEDERGRYTASSGDDSNCLVDVKIEVIPAGNLETVNVTCLPS
jgi:hypothetical protein